MGKNLFITEKPSVAMSFIDALGINGKKHDGYVEDDGNIVTWCVGHLVTLAYPESYDPELKKWSFNTLPFIPEKYKYEVIGDVKDQYKVVAGLLNRKDVSRIYYSGDSAREGEYIQRLVRQKAGHNKDAEEYRVWIDSQTPEEIVNGVKGAKPLSCYDSLSDAGYMRAIEDYITGINFSRALSVKYGDQVNAVCGEQQGAIAVGRVMSCVLGMVVDRERLIRGTAQLPFYGVETQGILPVFTWKAESPSKYKDSPLLFKDTGFKERKDAETLAKGLETGRLIVKNISRQTVKKNAPLLYNLAELQSDCSRLLKIEPDKTLQAAQSLYEKKLTTYPRTDARVLTTAIAKVIRQNINGLTGLDEIGDIANDILTSGSYKNIAATKYVNDSLVSDHYAIIPTGLTGGLDALTETEGRVYMMVVRRFLAIFLEAAETRKLSACALNGDEPFYASASRLEKAGWMGIYGEEAGEGDEGFNELSGYKEGQVLDAGYVIHEGKTSPPPRYNSGSIILAMENAGQLIEEEELREQIKGSGIGTSSTRAETLKKLKTNGTIQINPKTQVITPTKKGEVMYEIIKLTIPSLLSPEMTASWEKGLSMIEAGDISAEEYNGKMSGYVRSVVAQVKDGSQAELFRQAMEALKATYSDINPDAGGGHTCPLCGKRLIPTKKGYMCEGYKKSCNVFIGDSYFGSPLSRQDMDDLADTGETQRKIKLKKKDGGTYTAKLIIGSDGRLKPKF